MMRACLAATVMVTTVMTTALYSTRAYSQIDNLSIFNAASDSIFSYTSTLIINSAIGESADIAADDNYQTQSSDSDYSSDLSDLASDTAWIAPANSNVPYEAISYSVDPAIRAEIMAQYVERSRQMDSAQGDQLEQILRDRDLISEFTQNARAYGLDVSDFGDVMTAYWAISWGAVNQTLILVDGGVEESLRTGNVVALQQLSQGVQQSNLDSMGIDLAAFDLTDEGLTPR